MNLAPNGKPSNLNAEQYKLVRTPAFKKWFGDWENDPKNASKVVDKNGEPLVVYHGTNFEFTIFKKEKPTIGAYGQGFYFTNDKDFASNYARGNSAKILNCFIRIKNIFIIDNDEFPTEYQKFSNMADNKGISRDFTRKIVSENYDGVYAKNRYNENELVVFEPNQIKLADGTNTTFDADNEDIRYKVGGTIDSGKANFGKPLDFDEWIFVHETNEEDAKSILENGFRPNQNPVITNGVYTIPKKWKDTKLGKGGVELEIKLKPNKKIFWTDSDRPMDFEIGYGNKFFVKLYKKLNKGEISPYEAYIVRGDMELWFEKKAVFSRKMENWLKENNYVGIQQGGEVVLTDLSGFTIINKLEFGGKILNWNYSIGGL